MSTPDCDVVCMIAGQVDVLANIAKDMPTIQRLISGVAYLLGVGFAMKALYSLKVYGEARTMMSSNTSVKEPLAYFLVAGMLIYLPTAFQVLMNTTFGHPNVIAYVPINSKNTTLEALFGGNSPVGRSIAIIIQTIGLIAFIRGWIMIARSTSQGQPAGGAGKGLMHVFGGIMAMNIVETLQIINNTLYGTS